MQEKFEVKKTVTEHSFNAEKRKNGGKKKEPENLIRK